MIQASAKGLDHARQVCRNREAAARQSKAEGRKLMGYLCSYPPLEMITAVDFVPFRLLGDVAEPVTRADAYLASIICPFLRSALDLGLKERYDFLDGFLGTHVCDCGEKFCHLWNYYLPSQYHHFIDIPHLVHEASFDFLKGGLELFQSTLEDYAGRPMSRERLKDEIRAHNQQRALVRELYELRQVDPPLLSGAENLEIMVALMSIPIEDGCELLREVIAEVKERQDGPQKKAARLLLWGSPLTDAGLIEMIEGLDGNVVMDDICIGSRHFWPDVELTEDPLDGIARRYLAELKCPRTFRETTESYAKDQEVRFGYLGDYARDWNVNGVIMQSVRYCDTHGYEVPALKDYLDGIGLPNLYLEHEYTMIALAPLRTRVQAFLEMMECS